MNKTFLIILIIFPMLIITSFCKKGSNENSYKNNTDFNTHKKEFPNQIELAKSSFSPISELNDQNMIQQQLSYMSGGAGGCANYGEDCVKKVTPGVCIYIGGIYSFKDQFSYPWWGTKTTSCKENIELGDMVEFLVRGFNANESIKFILEGPKLKKTYFSKVLEFKRMDGGCDVVLETYYAAPFSWLATKDWGIGDYTLTAIGSTESTQLSFVVSTNKSPNFGLCFGNTGKPLILSANEKIELTIVGFKPNKKVTALLFQDQDRQQVLVGYINVVTDEKGDCFKEIDWPNIYPSGGYSILIPELIPNNSGNADALGAIWFFVDKNNEINCYIQIGSFVNKENAELLCNKFSNKYNNIFVYNDKKNENELFKVRIPVSDDSKISELIASLTSDGFKPFIVKTK